MTHASTLSLLSFLVLSGCGGLQTAAPVSPPQAEPSAALPAASGGLRGALSSACNVEVPDAADLIAIANAQMGPDSATTAQRFCELLKAQHPVGATGVAQTLRVAFPDGGSATVTRTAS